MVVIELFKVEGMFRYSLLAGTVEARSTQTIGVYQREFVRIKTDSVFVYERWTSNEYGTDTWIVIVGRASTCSEAIRTPGVHPEFTQLCRAQGKRQVEKIKMLLAKIGADIELVTDSYWTKINAMMPTKQVITYDKKLNTHKK